MTPKRISCISVCLPDSLECARIVKTSSIETQPFSSRPSQKKSTAIVDVGEQLNIRSQNRDLFEAKTKKHKYKRMFRIFGVVLSSFVPNPPLATHQPLQEQPKHTRAYSPAPSCSQDVGLAPRVGVVPSCWSPVCSRAETNKLRERVIYIFDTLHVQAQHDGVCSKYTEKRRVRTLRRKSVSRAIASYPQMCVKELVG